MRERKREKNRSRKSETLFTGLGHTVIPFQSSSLPGSCACSDLFSSQLDWGLELWLACSCQLHSLVCCELCHRHWDDIMVLTYPIVLICIYGLLLSFFFFSLLKVWHFIPMKFQFLSCTFYCVKYIPQ